MINLGGVALIVVSNTAVLLNLLVALALPDLIEDNKYLNPNIVGFNADVVLSALAVSVVCGSPGKVLVRLCKLKRQVGVVEKRGPNTVKVAAFTAVAPEGK
jgi:hypothetical protein